MAEDENIPIPELIDRPRGRGRRALSKLTASQVAKLAKVKGDHCDGGGLYLQVNAHGAASWIFRFAVPGRRYDRFMGLGPLHTVSLAEAREKALECRRLRLQGKDPIEERNLKRLREAIRERIGDELVVEQPNPSPMERLLSLNQLLRLPRMLTLAGVYFLLMGDAILYIGQSTNISKRIEQHSKGRTIPFTDWTFIPCQVHDLDIVEASYIRKFSPPFNRREKRRLLKYDTAIANQGSGLGSQLT